MISARRKLLLGFLGVLLLRFGGMGSEAQAKTLSAVKAGLGKPKVVPVPTPIPIATSEKDASPSKPALETLLKAKSLKRVLEDNYVVTNSEWQDNDDFTFVNAARICTPLRYARPKIMDFSLYPKMSDAIKKFMYDESTQTIEVIGEASGLRMHSWMKVDQRYWDEIHYTIVRGDMTGFKVQAYLWDKEGKTIALAKGLLPEGKKMLPGFVTLLFKPVSEIVIGVATKRFRSYIEEEYEKAKH